MAISHLATWQLSAARQMYRCDYPPVLAAIVSVRCWGIRRNVSLVVHVGLSIDYQHLYKTLTAFSWLGGTV